MGFRTNTKKQQKVAKLTNNHLMHKVTIPKTAMLLTDSESTIFTIRFHNLLPSYSSSWDIQKVNMGGVVNTLKLVLNLIL